MSPFKILHTADLHVGDSRSLPDYLVRQEKMLAEITRIAIDQEVDVVVIAGDVCDAKRMFEREKDMLLKWMVEHDRAGEKHDFWSIFMSGNHDEIESSYTHLRPHKILADYSMFKRTYVVEGQPQLIGPIKDQAWFAVLPAPTHRYEGEEINDTVAALRKSLIKKLEAKDKSIKDVYFVAMIHEAVDGAVNEIGTHRTRKGPTISQGIGVTYWALGDIHKPFQKILPNAWYPGSPIQHDFGDVSQERGVLVVDLDHPEDPKKVLVEGIVPLVTVTEVPREWPKDQIIRFEGKPQEISETVFPSNVVGFKPVVGDVKIMVNTEGDDLLDGIDEVFRDHRIPEELQESVVKVIREASIL